MGSLVLTRKAGQAVLIEHGLVRIDIVWTKGSYVRLKITGNCKVDRAEKVEVDLLNQISPQEETDDAES